MEGGGGGGDGWCWVNDMQITAGRRYEPQSAAEHLGAARSVVTSLQPISQTVRLIGQ